MKRYFVNSGSILGSTFVTLYKSNNFSNILQIIKYVCEILLFGYYFFSLLLNTHITLSFKCLRYLKLYMKFTVRGWYTSLRQTNLIELIILKTHSSKNTKEKYKTKYIDVFEVSWIIGVHSTLTVMFINTFIV